jgi:hypothetical protein
MDDTTPAAGPEILIGSTNRKVSQQSQAGLSRYDHRITVQGEDIAIVGGGDMAIQAAVNAFVSTYLPDYSILGEKQMKTVELSASLDTFGSCDPQAIYGSLDYSEDMIGHAVDIVPWAYLWRRGEEEQTKPEAEFIPRRLERIDTVYRTAMEELGPNQIGSIFYNQPDILKELPASPEYPLLLGALWVGSLANYTVTLTWPGSYVPDPVEVEVRTYPTAWGWFGWTVDQILPVAKVSGDGRTWTYNCPRGQVMDHSYSTQVASATEMIAVFAPEGIDVPEARYGIVLSGSAVPRQRIQRLGRIIRTAPGKEAACLYYIYIRQSADDAAFLPGLEQCETFGLRYYARERSFSNEPYELAASELLSRAENFEPSSLWELRDCLVEGQTRPDCLLSPAAQERHIHAAATVHERNYWRCMKKIGGMLRGTGK